MKRKKRIRDFKYFNMKFPWKIQYHCWIHYTYKYCMVRIFKPLLLGQKEDSQNEFNRIFCCQCNRWTKDSPEVLLPKTICGSVANKYFFCWKHNNCVSIIWCTMYSYEAVRYFVYMYTYYKYLYIYFASFTHTFCNIDIDYCRTVPSLLY